MNDDNYILTNRQQAQRSRKSKFWCGHCDAQIVGEVGKCNVCGKTNKKNRKRLK
jgi:hypothetical protein